VSLSLSLISLITGVLGPAALLVLARRTPPAPVP
jgi:hypothetical protein